MALRPTNVCSWTRRLASRIGIICDRVAQQQQRLYGGRKEERREILVTKHFAKGFDPLTSFSLLRSIIFLLLQYLIS